MKVFPSSHVKLALHYREVYHNFYFPFYTCIQLAPKPQPDITENSINSGWVEATEYLFNCKWQSIMYHSVYSVPREMNHFYPFVFCPVRVAHPKLFPFSLTSVDWQRSVTALDIAALPTATMLQGMSTAELRGSHWPESRGYDRWLFWLCNGIHGTDVGLGHNTKDGDLGSHTRFYSLNVRCIILLLLLISSAR